VVEHLRPVEQVLRDGERSMGIAGEKHALGQVGCRPQVDGTGLVLEGHAAANPSHVTGGGRVEDSGSYGEAPDDTG
jgi:hypothetical protein